MGNLSLPEIKEESILKPTNATTSIISRSRRAFRSLNYSILPKTGKHKKTPMRLILAILLPWLQFFTIGRPFAGLICLLLQITLIGWIPAAIWSVYALSQYKTDQKISEAFR
jgi:uncharacterized membrane protein YqaE (UPF0057 family)